MEKEINIAEILKNMPKGTKLYDYLYDREVKLDKISTVDGESVIWCEREEPAKVITHLGYSIFGTLRGHEDGLQILLPSKSMQDWTKFAWKKGDVLKCKDCDIEVIFEAFLDCSYTSFRSKHYLDRIDMNNVIYQEADEYLLTLDFTKEEDEEAQDYINTIEKKLGGKLNMETLEIEPNKPKCEYSNGEVLVAINGHKKWIILARTNGDVVNGNNINYYAIYRYLYNGVQELSVSDSFMELEGKTLRKAKNKEKHILFNALKKEKYYWSQKTEQLEKLNHAVFKPFLKFLTKDAETDKWEIDFYSHWDDNECAHKFLMGGSVTDNEIGIKAIPYRGNEYLLGK